MQLPWKWHLAYLALQHRSAVKNWNADDSGYYSYDTGKEDVKDESFLVIFENGIKKSCKTPSFFWRWEQQLFVLLLSGGALLGKKYAVWK